MGIFSWLFKRKQKEHLLEWQDKYRVGITEIDIQHQRLFGLYNDLVAALYRGEGIETLGGTLDELLRYVVVHFRTEENYFDRYRYPAAAEHKGLHQDLMKKTYHVHKEFTEGKPVLTEDVLIFLRNWVSEHIFGEDHKYRSFLIKKIPQA